MYNIAVKMEKIFHKNGKFEICIHQLFLHNTYVVHSTYYLELEKENIIYLKGLHKVSVQIHFFFD